MREYDTEWIDMSPWLVHFTKETETADSYSQMMSILSGRGLEPSSLGVFRDKAPEGTQPKVACLSEIPPGLWSRLAIRRNSVHGIGFKKEFVIKAGGNPLWYIWEGTPIHRKLQEIAASNIGNVESGFWDLTSMIQFQKQSHQWDWEREWRVPGGLSFEPSDVAFLFIPEELHQSARGFFENARVENLGPSYVCPFIDAGWNGEQTRRELMIQSHEYGGINPESWLDQFV